MNLRFYVTSETNSGQTAFEELTRRVSFPVTSYFPMIILFDYTIFS